MEIFINKILPRARYTKAFSRFFLVFYVLFVTSFTFSPLYNVLSATFIVETPNPVATDCSDAGFPVAVGDECYNSIQDAIDIAPIGDTIEIKNGNYTISSTINVNKTVTITGESQAGVNLDMTGINGYGFLVTADNVVIQNLTVQGTNTGVNSNYTFKFGNATPIISNGVLSNITVNGSYRSPFDIHGVNNMTLQNLNALNTIRGNGIQLTGVDGAGITGYSGSGNAWGDIAIYTSLFTTPNIGSSNIVIGPTDSSAVIYSQDNSAAGLFSSNISVDGRAAVTDPTLPDYTFYVVDNSGAIQGRTFLDQNDNGLLLSADGDYPSGMSDGYTVLLYDNAWNFVESQTTNTTGEIGQYRFENLNVPNTYFVCGSHNAPEIAVAPAIGQTLVDTNGNAIPAGYAYGETVTNNSGNTLESNNCWQINLTSTENEAAWVGIGYIQNIPPVVDITSHNNGDIVNGDSFEALVTATDDLGMGSYYIRLWQDAPYVINGGTLVGNCQEAPGGNNLGVSRNDSCTFDISSLPNGTYYITAQYLDSSTQWGSDVVEITIENTLEAPTFLGWNSQVDGDNIGDTPVSFTCGETFDGTTGNRISGTWTEVTSPLGTVRYIRHNERPNGNPDLLLWNGGNITVDGSLLDDPATLEAALETAIGSYNQPYTPWGAFGASTGTYTIRVIAFVDANDDGRYNSGELLSDWSNDCEITNDVIPTTFEFNLKSLVCVNSSSTGDETFNINGTDYTNAELRSEYTDFNNTDCIPAESIEVSIMHDEDNINGAGPGSPPITDLGIFTTDANGEIIETLNNEGRYEVRVQDTTNLVAFACERDGIGINNISNEGEYALPFSDENSNNLFGECIAIFNNPVVETPFFWVEEDTSEVLVQWNNIAGGEVYRIYRDGILAHENTDTNLNSWIDTTPGTEYEVRAVINGNESDPSDTKSIELMDIVVDDNAAFEDHNSNGVISTTGNWITYGMPGTTANHTTAPYALDDAVGGDVYGTAPSNGQTLTWTTNNTLNGRYEVYISYLCTPRRDSAEYSVNGNTPVVINQSLEGDQITACPDTGLLNNQTPSGWVSIGEYNFFNEQGEVTLDTSISNANITADAVAFRFVDNNETDISIEKDSDSNNLRVNSVIEYIITIENSSSTDAFDLEIVDTLPNGITFDSFIENNSTCSEDNNVISCTIPELLAGESEQIIIFGVIRSTGTLTNSVEVTTSTDDSDLDNNIATHTIRISSTGGGGNPDDIPSVILTPNDPVIEFGENLSVEASYEGEDTPLSLEWGGVCSEFDGEGGTLSGLVVGEYTCSVIVTDSDGDSTSDEIVIEVIEDTDNSNNNTQSPSLLINSFTIEEAQLNQVILGVNNSTICNENGNDGACNDLIWEVKVSNGEWIEIFRGPIGTFNLEVDENNSNGLVQTYQYSEYETGINGFFTDDPINPEIRVSFADNEFSNISDSATVIINNIMPSVTLSVTDGEEIVTGTNGFTPSINIDAGEIVALTGRFSDPAGNFDAGPGWQARYNFGGTGFFNGQVIQDNNTDYSIEIGETSYVNGTYLATLRVCEEDNLYGYCSFASVNIIVTGGTADQIPDNSIGADGEPQGTIEGEQEQLLEEGDVEGATEGIEDEGQVLGEQTCVETVEVSGFVFLDSNGNGQIDDNEEVYENILIAIYSVEGEDRKQLAEVETNRNGRWDYNVCSGEYEVVIDTDSIDGNLDKDVISLLVNDEGVDDVNFLVSENDESFNPIWLIIPFLLLAIAGGVYYYSQNQGKPKE